MRCYRPVLCVLLGVAACLTGCDAFDSPGPREANPMEFTRPRAIPRARPRAIPPPTPKLDSGPDYLLPTQSATPEPTLAEEDTLAGTPKMPTKHSHWLRGSIVGGSVTVVLNGKPMGELTGNPDRDITMSCRNGANTISFTFHPTPGYSSSFARLEVVESEHDVPIPPLATFSRTGDPKQGAKTMNAASAAANSETSVFIAR